ncbi:hypothetical protein F2Q69_00041102 [Brassica cretica]|uniref:Reverse transcriptase zinc-binding domain-containing protein n=1 Tax=Brassica cretica TaxID=69181 RepID=A0A8S9NI24_BRACR|nr:hypothetical protein F2Q69_00041102 [Brassica cretica]
MKCILSGALAVKDRLRSRSIHLDTTCSSCHEGTENIGHVLFHSRFAQQVWALSSVPMPPSGSWSRSVFLNMHHLISFTKKNRLAPEAGYVFPWILWHIWKAKNCFCFEYTRINPTVILDKAMMEAEIWRDLHTRSQERLSSSVTRNLSCMGQTSPRLGEVQYSVVVGG